MTSIPTESFAAVDLGSNSFHMIVAGFADGHLQVIDRIKEMVRLASGLDKKRNLTPESIHEALHCLEKFGQRIREIPYVNVRAVGTNTLRQARNGQEFLLSARQALGHPIEIISGREEARLVYLGVAHSVYDENSQRLVIDIGGGSTELIIGKAFKEHFTESLYMGCVNVTQRFFPDDKVTEKRMRKAILFVRQELEAIQEPYKKAGWDKVLGSSGTIRCINDILRSRQWSEHGITLDGLNSLKNYLISKEYYHKLDFQDLSERRRPVFVGGVAVLCGIFEAFDIDLMNISDGALREGLLHDLIGRVHNEDIRDKTVADLRQKYNVDSEQSERVKRTALALYEQAKTNWELTGKENVKLLSWACDLHEIGLSVAHSQYHRHGAYLIAHSDLAGFSHQDQFSLAALIRSHRRKFAINGFDVSPEERKDVIFSLSVLLRLAVVLHRSRFYTALPKIEIEAKDKALSLLFPENWLENHPLTSTDLETEKEFLEAAGVTLSYR